MMHLWRLKTVSIPGKNWWSVGGIVKKYLCANCGKLADSASQTERCMRKFTKGGR